VLITKNYRARYGEIDLILKDKATIVFAEVRSRNSMVFGGAAASVTYTKQQKIIKTAMHYLLTHKLHNKMPMRFDVIAFEGKTEELHWIKHAFGSD
jgi:putative endonuclease